MKEPDKGTSAILSGHYAASAAAGAGADSPCVTLGRDESSRIVAAPAAVRTSAEGPEATGAAGIPRTGDAALRLAIKLAVDEGDFDRAAALLGVIRGP